MPRKSLRILAWLASLRRPRNPLDETSTRVTIGRDVTCADFIAGDQITTYGFTAADVNRLIDRVLAVLQAGATFVPHGDALRAEVNGETLTFHPGAVKQLIGCRNERSYLLAVTVHREYQVWATKFIPLAAQMDVKRAVEGLDLPIAFSEFRIPRDGKGLDARITTVPLADITEALNKHSAFVILGEPGAGKTTTLQKIAFESARTLLSGGEGRVPLFIRLSQQGTRTPFDFVKFEWEQRIGSDLEDALADGRVLLLADGVNELPRDVRDERLKAWRLFTSDYCEANQIVFSGRERDYDRQLDLPRVRVEPLDDARIADYLRRNDAVGLSAMLDEAKTRLRDMARNPFNLSLLVAAYKDNQRDMANRGWLLHWFVDNLFSREEKLAHRGWLPRTVQMRALQELAYTMQQQGESTTFAFKTAKAALPTSMEFNGDEVVVKATDLLRFGRAATILDPTLEPDVRFYHHLLQEYFAGLELLRRFDEGEDLSALWRCKRTIDEMPPATAVEWAPLPEPPATGWEVTTILACGLARDPAKLIEAIRSVNPVLAGRCLDEAGIVNLADDNPFARYPLVARIVPRVRADLINDLYSPTIHRRARLQAGFTLGRIGDPRFQPQIINGVKVIVPMLVQVPSGRYTIGSVDDDADAYDNEHPQHTVDLPAFEISKWPVTNAEFKCFMDGGGYHDEQHWTTKLAKRWLRGEDVAGGQFATWLEIWRVLRNTPKWKEQIKRTGPYSPEQLKWFEYIASLVEKDWMTAQVGPQLSAKSRERPAFWTDADRNNPSQPVVGITWFEANAYCAWLSGVTGRDYRLPTEVEWEAAARGLALPLSASEKGSGTGVRVYPWGDDWNVSRANTIEGRVQKASPVGAYAAAGGTQLFDAGDQSGNVYEWTNTIYGPYSAEITDYEFPEAEGERTVRGGSWDSLRRGARCAARGRLIPVYFNDSIGFRVVAPGS